MQARETNRQGSDIVLECRTPVEPAQAILCDVSPTGCRIEFFEGYAPKGSTIFFHLDDETEIAGQVVWVSGNEAGVQFMHALSPQAGAMLEL